MENMLCALLQHLCSSDMIDIIFGGLAVPPRFPIIEFHTYWQQFSDPDFGLIEYMFFPSLEITDIALDGC